MGVPNQLHPRKYANKKLQIFSHLSSTLKMFFLFKGNIEIKNKTKKKTKFDISFSSVEIIKAYSANG